MALFTLKVYSFGTFSGLKWGLLKKNLTTKLCWHNHAGFRVIEITHFCLASTPQAVSLPFCGETATADDPNEGTGDGCDDSNGNTDRLIGHMFGHKKLVYYFYLRNLSTCVKQSIKLIPARCLCRFRPFIGRSATNWDTSRRNESQSCPTQWEEVV